MSQSVVRLFKYKPALIAALAMALGAAAQAQDCSNPAAANITSPSPGSVLSAPVTFQWDAGACVTNFYLFVGSSLGAPDLFSGSTGLTQSATVSLLPTDGRTIYVRLMSNVNGAFVSKDYTYKASGTGGGGGGGGGGCASPAAAALSSPTPGSVLAGSSVAFSWTAGSCVTNYQLLVGSSLGASDISSTSGANTSATVNNIPVDGRTIFVRLISTVNGSAQQVDYTFQAASGGGGGGGGFLGGGGGGGIGCGTPAPATLTSPAAGSRLGSSATFTWTAGTCVTSYALQIGSSLGASDIFSNAFGANLSGTVNNLPTDGRTIYVRLISTIAGGTQSNDYTFIAGGGGGGGNCNSPAAAILTSPSNGTTLGGSSVSFSWSAGNCVTNYTLSIGNSAGAGDLYSASQGTNLSVTVNNLPTDGRNLFVRLTSTINGSAQSNDYTFKAAGGSGGGTGGCSQSLLATMTTPANNATLTSGSQQFVWQPGCNVTAYFLYIGSTPGAFDLYFQSQGTQTSTTVGNLPTDGRTLYVRLWSLFTGASDIASGWQFNDYVYKAFTNANACASPAAATMITPANNAVFTSASQTFTWNQGSCVSAYSLSIGSQAGASDIYQQSQGISLSTTVNNLPTDGRTLYVRLTSTINGQPQNQDYTYTAFTSGGGCGTSQLATMATPAGGTGLSSGSVTFTWNAGCNVTTYFLYVGTAQGGYDLYFQNQGTATSVTVNGLPTDGRTLYVRLWSLFNGVNDIANGWQFNDYNYTAFNSGGSCTTPAGASITSPAGGTVLGASPVTFQWGGGSCVVQYTLSIGSTAGGTDLYSASQGTNLNATVAVPTDGRTLYVRLTTTTSTGGPFINDYTYTAPTVGSGCGANALAMLTSPNNNAVLGTSQTFSWSAGCNALAYFIYVGTTVGQFDIYFKNQGLSTSTTINGLPTGSKTLYFRLWTLFPSSGDISGGWQSVDYVFTSAP